AALALALTWGVARLRGRTDIADACFALTLLHWGHCQNLLWAWQACFVLPTVLIGTLFLLLAGWKDRTRPLGRTALFGFCFPLVPWGGAVALPFGPFLASCRGRTPLALVFRGGPARDSKVSWL